MKELLLEKAAELGIQIEKMEVMPDHVHLFVKGKPSIAVQHIVNQLKGYTSVMLRREFPRLKSRLPTLWTRSYYVESVGHISESTITKYIEDQKKV
jgi:putative transposase